MIIPTYNNGKTLLRVLEGVRAAARLVIVVDDGSTDDTRALLAGQRDLVVITHVVNRGKGAAMMAGFSEARRRGASHAATIDADGQHDPRDLGSLMAYAARHPDHLVIGVRQMDEAAGDVPGSSRFGRRFSNFWVFCETGLRLADTQSGLRVYPLKPLEPLLLSRQHYDFEIEILVRAAWAGVPVAEHPVSVHYPPRRERVSHFRPWVDNGRLTLLHTLLVIHRCMRPFDRLVGWSSRAFKPRLDKGVGRERGGAPLLKFFLGCCGPEFCYLIAPFVLLYYYATGGSARRGIKALYRRLSGRRARFWDSFRNFLYFACSLIDRLVLASGRAAWDERVVSVSGRDKFDRGVIVVGAHFGDWLMCGTGLMARNERPLHVVMDPHLSPRFVATIKGTLGQNFQIIDATQGGLAVGLLVRDALEQGGIVCFLADRPGPEAGTTLDFLGAPARFSRTPFAFARLFNCPVYSFYCLKSDLRPLASYMVCSQELWDGEEAIDEGELVVRFRDDLATRVRAHPQHWFNFFDFWSTTESHERFIAGNLQVQPDHA